MADKAPAKRSPPKDLGARGRAFWRRTLDEFELSEVEVELLRECCRLLDECESMRASVEHDGTTVKGSTGQVRVHPALGELRQHRLALGRLLAQIALPDVDEQTLRSPTQARASKAAQARWASHNARRAAADG